MSNQVDTNFNFYTDTPPNKDPDSRSPTLRRYHRTLWSKKLPSGQLFQLIDTRPRTYLYHKSGLGEFFLNSDAITHSYRDVKRMSKVIRDVPTGDVQSLFDQGSTIAAYIVFPGNKIDNQRTINGERGCLRQIADRFDLTLECIRRHYDNGESPLTPVLKRYSDFFALFESFRGYVDFFHLQDLVAADYRSVQFHLPYKCFEGSAYPTSREEYRQYRENTIRFIQSRAKRIERSLRQ